MTENSKPYGNRLILRADRVSTPGVDYETHRISVVARNKETIVLKVPGHSCWDGNYTPRRYVSPSIMVYRILKSEIKQGSEYLDVEPLIEWDCGRKKKE